MSAESKQLERGAGRLEQRRESFLREAEALFLAQGYAGASVNEIVRRAGGSLATLYNEFGSKEQLFAEIMRRRAALVFRSVDAEFAEPRSARPALLALASRLLERILRDDGLALYRIMISESHRLPDLREAVLQSSYPAFIGNLARLLVSLKLAPAAESVAAAEEFLSLVHGQLVFRAMCGDAISAKQKTEQVERAVDAFLSLHPTRGRGEQERSG